MTASRGAAGLASGLLVALAIVVAPRAGGRSWVPVDQSPATSPQTLVVVGIDAFRPDYLDRANVPVLRRLAAGGVRAAGFVPPFPSKTFASFLTIATGLYPVRHGIVNNTMDDPAIPVRFRLSDHAARSDARWWLGEPIWVTAERQGIRASGIFWPGDDVEIQGRRPSYWRTYQDDYPNDARVDQLLADLSRPATERPRLAMVYFSLVDLVSHDHGPHAPETYAAAAAADALVGRLVDGLASRDLLASTSLIVVSDHGMAATTPDRVIVLDDYLDPASVDVIETGPSVRLQPRGLDARSARATAAWTTRTLARLRGKHPRMQVFRGDALPARFHTRDSPRIPPIIGLADDGWLVLTRAERNRWLERGGGIRGEHGHDPALPSMHGLFVAAGPAFRAGVRLPAVESRHAYELFCRVLGIQPSKNDGDPATWRSALRATSPRRR